MSAEDVINETRGRLEALLAPIDGGVGQDVSYDTTFEAMKAEVDKLQAIEGGKLDWQSLVSSGVELLSERSKDFRVALYYAAARGNLGGLPGLLEGLVLVAELNKAFWEPMYPPLKRPKARGNLIGWYSDVVGPAVQAFNPGLAERPICLAIDQVSQGLDSEFREKLGEAYPGMGALREGVRLLMGRLPPEPPPPPPPGIEPPPPSSRAVQLQQQQQQQQQQPQAAAGVMAGGPSPEAIVDVDSALRVLGDGVALFAKAADVMLQANEADPVGFRLGRLAAWLLVNEAPPNEDGRTQIPPPPPTLMPNVRELTDAMNWQGVANVADMGATESPYWLDGVRILVQALDMLGETHARARAVVVGELGALLARVPELLGLTFSDGSPFADDDTKAWIASTVQGGGGGGGGAPAAGPVDKVLVEAKQLASEGQLAPAVALMTRAIGQTAGAPLRFKARLELAKMCLDAGLPEIAGAELEGLERIAEQHRLIDWEPKLCTDLYAYLYRARRDASRNNDDPELRAKTATSFERLCQLDANEALRLLQG